MTPLQPAIPILPFARSALKLAPYDWQARTLCAIELGKPVALATANGAGKSTIILPAAILWFLFNNPRGRCVVTSGSWTQLENQLFSGLRQYSGAPAFRGWSFLDTEVRTPQGGFALGVSTDTPERIEGWHSRPGSPLMFVVDEAKGVRDSIYQGIARCTIDYKILASSTGVPQGQFYRCFNEERGSWWTLRVPSTECPHITDAKREADRRACAHYPHLYRWIHEAEFSDDDNGMAIVSSALLRANLENPPVHVAGSRSAFCDFAAGGAENVLAVRDGNRIFIAAAWREEDTVQGARQFIAEFERLKLLPGSIWGDEGGLGTVMCDALRDMRWNINRVNNGAAAKRNDIYLNLGSETWFEAKRAIANREYILPDDPVFIRQATDRRVEYTSTQKLRAESKADMSRRGVSSPDRADAIFGVMMTGSGGWSGGGITARDLAGITLGGMSLYPNDFGGGYEEAPSLAGVEDVSEVRRYPAL
jgi:phage terminase large subunit